MRTIAVLGAGNGGCAAAADLTHRGYEVRLYTRSVETLGPIADRGGIEFEGVIGQGFAEVSQITTDLAEAVLGAELLLLVVPSTAHEYYASALAPLLTDDQIVLLNPGHTGGGLHFATSLRRLGFRKPLRICETASLTYTCRLTGPARVAIYNVVPDMAFASFPGKHMNELAEVVKEVFPSISPAKNVLETGLMNLNAVMHPPGTLLNAGWIEYTKGDFYYYYEGITPAIGEIIEVTDRERLEIGKALGFDLTGFVRKMYEGGYTSEKGLASESVYCALQESAADRWIKSHETLDHRYMHEDIGYGLVPMVGIAELAAVDTPIMKSMVDVGSALSGIDYWSWGRTLDKMGLSGITPTDLERFLSEGTPTVQ